jgi:hypothetical protein
MDRRLRHYYPLKALRARHSSANHTRPKRPMAFMQRNRREASASRSLTPSLGAQKMSYQEEHATVIASHLHGIATEVEAKSAMGTIDWTRIVNLIMQILPLILPFLQSDPSKKD